MITSRECIEIEGRFEEVRCREIFKTVQDTVEGVKTGLNKIVDDMKKESNPTAAATETAVKMAVQVLQELLLAVLMVMQVNYLLMIMQVMLLLQLKQRKMQQRLLGQ
ncbi:Variable outer membrane protein (plasmid) [Borrelia crocidurae DOU]|uniref:Variable large protein n=1 Tax=Borrelia crocidurae DOU TaxID=1293575 RepID=W5SIQ2_9SPIR|nr:Variable outer membrane protein [Borrelia crocidurae DOU]